MLKLLNILAIACLTISPGMNAGVLVHSLQLCHAGQPVVAAPAPATSHVGCDQHTHSSETPRDAEPGGEDSDDGCPHLCDGIDQLPAMAGIQLQPESQTAAVVFRFPSTTVTAPLRIVRSSNAESRPPPDPGLTGTTILLI